MCVNHEHPHVWGESSNQHFSRGVPVYHSAGSAGKIPLPRLIRRCSNLWIKTVMTSWKPGKMWKISETVQTMFFASFLEYSWTCFCYFPKTEVDTCKSLLQLFGPLFLGVNSSLAVGQLRHLRVWWRLWRSQPGDMLSVATHGNALDCAHGEAWCMCSITYSSTLRYTYTYIYMHVYIYTHTKLQILLDIMDKTYLQRQACSHL